MLHDQPSKTTTTPPEAKHGPKAPTVPGRSQHPAQPTCEEGPRPYDRNVTPPGNVNKTTTYNCVPSNRWIVPQDSDYLVRSSVYNNNQPDLTPFPPPGTVSTCYPSTE